METKQYNNNLSKTQQDPDWSFYRILGYCIESNFVCHTVYKKIWVLYIFGKNLLYLYENFTFLHYVLYHYPSIKIFVHCINELILYIYICMYKNI